MFPFINIFGLALPVAPFTYLLGIWFGLSLAEKHSHRFKIAPDTLNNLVLVFLISSVIGARLSYVAQFPNAFIADPASLISINFGLFDLVGGIVIGLIFSLIYGQRKKIAFLSSLDAITPILAVFMLAIPFANLAAGFAYGAETNLPWAIDLWGANRHPAQIYEFIGAALILWFFWPGKLPKSIISGTYFLQLIAISSFARLFFEIFRGDSLITMYNLRWAQILAWLLLAFAIWANYKLINKKASQ